MGKEKFYQKTKEIDGRVYTAQFGGLSVALKMLNESHDRNGNVDFEEAARYVLENIIVEPPGLEIDDFEDMDTLNAVVAFGREVAQGKFRNKKGKAADPAKGA